MRVEGADLDLTGLEIHPGLINAHDHLQFALFPRLGSGPYPNATMWAHDIYHPEREPVRSHLTVPKRVRLIWGGLRNLIAGVTTVSHHDEYHPVFDADFPVRVVKNYAWAHSLQFTPNVREYFDRTAPDAPFLIHLAEGTDSSAAEEVFRLRELGALTERTVLIHAVGLDVEGWDLVRRARASVIWCPRSNVFTLGRTLGREALESGVPIALGTDSSLTAEGDLLDEIRFAGLFDNSAASRILRLPPTPDDWIAVSATSCPPQLVVIDGTIRLIDPRLASALSPDLRRQFHSLQIEGRPAVLVRVDILRLLQETVLYLDNVRLAGRQVLL
jgi:cytosine/adenosine deaminase-related metal-dependent hydrolase